jgi:hypothetical protein
MCSPVDRPDRQIRGAKRGANAGRPRAMRGDLARRLLQLDGISGYSQRQPATAKLRLKSGRSMVGPVGRFPVRRLDSQHGLHWRKHWRRLGAGRAWVGGCVLSALCRLISTDHAGRPFVTSKLGWRVGEASRFRAGSRWAAGLGLLRPPCGHSLVAPRRSRCAVGRSLACNTAEVLRLFPGAGS